MKKLILIQFIFFMLQLSAQTTGWNGVGFNKYATQLDKDALVSTSGAITEFRYRIDKDQVINTAAVIALANQYQSDGKQLDIVVTAKANANIFNFDVVDEIYKSGHIPFIELGNERYASQFKHTFDSYIAEFQSTIDTIVSVYPNATFLVNVVPRPEESNIPGPKKNSKAWNDAAKEYILAHTGTRVSWHLYLNEKDFSKLKTAPSAIAFNPIEVDARLPSFYDSLAAYNCILPQQVIDYLQIQFPNAYVHFTEIGIVPSDDETLDNDDVGTSLIRNTIAYSGLIYEILHELFVYPYTASVDIHAGVTLNGMIAPSSKFDSAPGNVKKMEFFCFELFNETGQLPQLPVSLDIASPGTYRYWFAYFHEIPSVEIPTNCTLTINCRYIAGDTWLTSGGSGYMGKGTAQITTFDGATYSASIPEFGWGYVELIIEKNPESTLCYKERLIFKSLGCKVDRSCKVNNCKQ